MRAFKVKYDDGTCEVMYAKDSLALIRRYDLASLKHRNTRIMQLSGEQEAIALASLEYQTK